MKQQWSNKTEGELIMMRSMHKRILAASISAAMLIVLAIPTFAATSKISSVSIKFTVEGYGEDGYPIIEASTSGSHYSVGSVDLEETSDDNTDTVDIDYANAKYGVDLSADDDYAFYITKASQVKLSGGGAKYVKASRQDNGTTLHVVVKFDKLDDFCGDVTEAAWDSNGKLTWNAAQNAKQYKLSVYGNGKAIASSIYTGATTYDCRPLMLEAGEYYVRITPETEEKKGNTEKIDSFMVTEEMAAQNKASYGLQKESVTINDGTGPTSISWRVLNAGWKQDARGWWYQNDAGDYIQYNWLQSGNDWYFFDSDGYMVTNTAVQWGKAKYYFDENGKMVANATIPDGRKAGADGTLSGKATDSSKVRNLYREEVSLVGPGQSLSGNETDEA